MALSGEIQKIYIAYFNRPADSAGLTYWVSQINSGQASIADITSAFATTQEYRDLYAGSTPSDVVTSVYKNLFGRAPEAEGLAYWVTELETGRLGIGTVAYQTLNGAQMADKAIVENKALAASDFTARLDAAGKGDEYTGDAIASARNWLSAIDDTAASLQSARSALDSVVKGFGDEGPAIPVGPARTFTYELGWDPADGFTMGPPKETGFPAINAFVLGHDKIRIVDLSGKAVTLPEPTLYYVEDWSIMGPENDWATVYNPDAFQFAIFGALGHGASGGKSDGWAPLMAGETILITYMTGGQQKTVLFIDDGEPGIGDGMDNGVGTAMWNLDSDVVLNLTGLVGLKTSSDGLFVDGSFF